MFYNVVKAYEQIFVSKIDKRWYEMNKAQHLTKDEELRLGGLVQEMIKSKEILENDSDVSRKEQQIHKTNIIRGEDAVEQLVIANTGLVYEQARNFKSKYPSAPAMEDLVQEGMAGLVTAIMRYDPSRNNKLSTVATYWIFQSITRWTNKTGRLVKLPENRVTDYTKIARYRKEYQESGMSKAEADAKIMKELNLSNDDMFFINGAASIPASLNRRVDDESDKELIEIVMDDVNDSAEATVLQEATAQILVDLINELSDIEKEVVVSQFSLDMIPGVSVSSPKVVKEKNELSAARFKRILTVALEKINSEMKDLDLSFEDFISA